MRVLLSGVNTEKKVEIFFINLLTLLYLSRIAIPILKFPFLVLYICLSIYIFIKYRSELIFNIIDYFKRYYLLILSGVLLFVSFLCSSKIYLIVFKDVVNMIILLSVLFLASIIVTTKYFLRIYTSTLIYLIILFALLTSIFDLGKLFRVFPYQQFIKGDETIETDYNFVLLPMFFAMIAIFNLLLKNRSKYEILILNILLIIFSFNIIISGSRRGIIIFALFLSFLLLAQILGLLISEKKLNDLCKASRYFLLSFFVLFCLIVFLAFNENKAVKLRTFDLVGSKILPSTKQQIALKIFKYISIFSNDYSFPKFYFRLWTCFPEDPDTGWGTRIHKTIFPLTGKNVEIVPGNVKGYLLDRTCIPSYYPELNIYESFTYVSFINVHKGDRYKASVYCYVSEDFDGSSVSFGNTSFSINDKIVSGNALTYYDLSVKGIWKKLELDFDCNDGGIPLLLSFTKTGEKEFSKLKGHVIFAYPVYEKVTNVLLKEESKENKLSSYFSIKKVNRTSFDQKYSLMSFDLIPLLNQHSFDSVNNSDTDPIRKWAFNLISEDTTYYPLKSKIILNSITDPFIEDRSLRWEFAAKIFEEEYDFKHKIFGGGFDFLNWYGYYFLGDKTKSDYPHNPFLHILLYSGIIGLLIYCFFLYKVFYYYIKYIKQYFMLFIFFLITFYFAFFSSGCPFDPPILGFLSILPFFIHAVHKKDKVEPVSDSTLKQE